MFNNQLFDKGIGVIGLQLAKMGQLEWFKLDAGMNVIQEGCIMILGTVFSQMKAIKHLDVSLEVSEILKSFGSIISLTRNLPCRKSSGPSRISPKLAH